MFRRPRDARSPALSLIVDGRGILFREGETVAGVLLAAGLVAFRQSPVSGAPRGPWCLMGACFECQVEIDGVPVRACMTPAKEGMRIATGRGRRSLVP